MRDYNYAQTFRSLGQLMHLVQDASVPAHVRNDGHVAFMYEDWLEKFMTKDTATFDSILASPTLALSPTLTSRVNYNADATIPIAGLFDTDTYTGLNPAITMAQDIGLAEYTNANFFSEETAFKGYAYPALSSVTIEDFPVPVLPSGSVYRPYYYKSGEGDAGYPLATMGYLFYYAHKYFPDSYRALAEKAMPALDSTCYEAYASRLLPRAVAYSSELLRYFFRGDVEAVDAKEVKGENKEVTGMSMKVKNATANEGMAGGDLVVSCRYQPANATEYTYTKSAEAAMSPLASGATSDGEYTFEFPVPIPSGATDMQYTLVYRGQLGAEKDAVAAKTFEITPDWGYLFIKQKEYKIADVGRKFYGLSDVKEFMASDAVFKDSGGAYNDFEHLSTRKMSFEFDLEWAGRMDKIVDVHVYAYSYVGEIDTTDPFYKIELTEPNRQNPIGRLSVSFALPKVYAEYNYSLPRINVTTEDSNGKRTIYYQHVIYSVNRQERWSRLNTSYQPYIRQKGVNFNSTIYLPCNYTNSSYVPDDYVVDQFQNYNIIMADTYCENKRAVKKQVINGGSSWNRYNSCANYIGEWYACLPKSYSAALMDFYTYHTTTVNVRRTWNANYLNSLKSKGYDISKFKDWVIPVECWETDEYN